VSRYRQKATIIAACKLEIREYAVAFHSVVFRIPDYPEGGTQGKSRSGKNG
jgi:hypothetical protein